MAESDTTVGLPCETCRGECIGLPLHYSYEVPEACVKVPWSQWDERIINNGSLLVIDWEEYFVKGVLHFPLIGTDEVLTLGVWTTLDERNFETIRDTWDLEGREHTVEPMVEKVASYAFGFQNTLDLNVIIRTQPVGRKPLLELEQSSHPLSVWQRNGVTMEQVHQYYVQFATQVPLKSDIIA